MPCLHEVCTAFFLFKAFQPLLVTYLHTVVLETLILWSWRFLFTLQSCWIITHILTAFSITFFTQFVKKKPAIYSLVCLVRSLLLTTCSLIVQTSSTIWQFLWLNGQSTVKIDVWALAQTLYAFIFMKELRKQKKTPKKTKIENLQNGQEKYGGKKFAYAHIWEKILKYHNFFKF